MDEILHKRILDIKSKEHVHAIVRDIKAKIYTMQDLMELYFGEHKRTTQYSSWIITHIAEKHIHLIRPYFKKMVENLEGNTNYTVVRNTIRAFQFAEIPEELEGILIDKCFEYLFEKKYPVAVKAFSIGVAEKIVMKHPELKEELILLLEEQIPYGSSGFKARAGKALKKLRKLSAGA